VLAIREKKPHPWIVGTSFHVSSGGELRNVAWDRERRVLKGVLQRPAGQLGFIVAAGLDTRLARAMVDEHPAPAHAGANSSLVIPIIPKEEVTRWEILLEKS